MRLGALVLVASALAGCVEPASPAANIPAVPGVAVQEGVSQRYVEIIGPRLQHAPPFLGVEDTNYFVLRSWLDRTTGEAHHQLYVSDSYSGAERSWDAATERDGTALRFSAISHEQIACDPGCSWTEDFAADIPDALLRAAPQGMAVDFRAKSGTAQRIVLSGDQVRAQLAAIDAERRRLVTTRG